MHWRVYIGCLIRTFRGEAMGLKSQSLGFVGSGLFMFAHCHCSKEVLYLNTKFMSSIILYEYSFLFDILHGTLWVSVLNLVNNETFWRVWLCPFLRGYVFNFIINPWWPFNYRSCGLIIELIFDALPRSGFTVAPMMIRLKWHWETLPYHWKLRVYRYLFLIYAVLK